MNSSLTTLQEIDESNNTTTINCDVEDLNKIINIRENDLTIITQNIRSIYKNFDDLQTTLTNLKHNIDVLVLTECQLDKDKSIPLLDNYISFNTSQHLNKNDGVTVYARSNLRPKVKEINLIHASCIQVDIFNYSILGIYRSPSIPNADNFIESLRLHLNTINKHQNIILTGDININLITKANESISEYNNRHMYLNMLSEIGILPGHITATRENSCLDHFMLKLNKQTISASVVILNTTITDHQMVLLYISKVKRIRLCPTTKTIINMDEALNSLANKNLKELMYYDDPNQLTEILLKTISEALQENTKTIQKPKSVRNIQPWITPGILRCIRNRNKMQKKLKNNPYDEILKITYKRYRNYCNNLIKKLKREYERKLLLVQDPKKLWTNIKHIANMKTVKSTNTELLELDKSPDISVNRINSYYANIGQELANNILNRNRTSHSNLNVASDLLRHPTSLAMTDTDPEEVALTIMSLKSDSAPGWDNISTRFLKVAKEVVSPIICHLANLCFAKGIFPNLLKRSIITPVYKGGNRDDVSNYRPISVLPAVSKILEKLLNNRLLNYLNKYNILSSSQYGFRQGKCTQDAILELTKKITQQLDHGKKSMAIYLDLKKAFDTVSVPTLVEKLERIGVRDIQLKLIKDYLTNRTQRVRVGNYTSDDYRMTFGVPQGSVLGPTLFLIYINDLCNMKLENGHVISYADDTAVVFEGATWEEAHSTAEAGMRKVSMWLNTNLLTLNTSKTNYMCFSINNRTQPLHSNIKIHNCNNLQDNCLCPSIEKVTSTKYLGVIIDHKLSWHNHIEVATNRVRKLIWIFKKLRNVATCKLLNQVYFGLAQSILAYCIPVWGGATKGKLLELERSQRSLLKIMYNKPYRYPTKQLYLECKLLSVRKLYILNLLLERHKTVTIDSSFKNKRRQKAISESIVKSNFATRQYNRQSELVYNKVNKTLNIFRLNLYNLKNKVTNWLNSLDYKEVENLLTILQ